MGGRRGGEGVGGEKGDLAKKEKGDRIKTMAGNVIQGVQSMTINHSSGCSRPYRSTETLQPEKERGLEKGGGA